MLLFHLILSESKIEASDLNIRLPFKLKNSDPPTYFIKILEKNVEYEIDADFVKLTKISRGRKETIFKIEVLEECSDSCAEKGATIYISKSSETLEIPVYISEINRIYLETTTLVLYCNSSLDRYSIRGYDKENNVFNSLSGYEIVWNFDKTHIISVPKNETDLPQSSEFSDVYNNEIIVKGIRLGKANISAHLKYNENIKTQTANLEIVFPIFFYPKEINIFPNTEYQGRLCSGIGIDKSKYGLSCDSPVDNLSMYSFFSDKDSFVEIDDNALIKSKNEGSSYIRARDKIMPLSKANMKVNVLNPTSLRIPDEWIIIGDKPKCIGYAFYDNHGKKLIPPEDTDLQLDGDYSTLGRHNIKAYSRGIAGSFDVYVCEMIRFDRDIAYLPKGFKNYKPVITGGSGSEYRVIIGTVPEAIKDFEVTVHDTKLNINITQKVIVEECISPNVSFDRTEVPIGEVFNFEVTCMSNTGRKLDNVQIQSVKSSDKRIAAVDKSHKFINTFSQGFVDVEISVIGGSVMTKLCVFKHLHVDDSVFNMTAKIPADINLRGGPLKWENAKQYKSVECGEISGSLSDDGKLTVESHFVGECTVTVVNEKTHLNPKPYSDSVSFMVSANSISRFVIIPVDCSSSNYEGFAPSYIPEITDVLDQYSIASTHTPKFFVHAISHENKDLGNFEHKNGVFEGKTVSGENYSFGNSVSEDIEVSYYVPDLDTPKSVLKLKSVGMFNLSSSELVLSTYNLDGKKVEFIGGSGVFEITSRNSDATISDNFIHVKPGKTYKRTITVRDVAVPEFTGKLLVLTKIPEKLVVHGPDCGLKDQPMILKISLVTKSDEVIDALDQEEIKCNDPAVKRINATHFSYTPTKTGAKQLKFNIEKNNKIKPGIFNTDISELIQFIDSNITIYVGETFPVQFKGGTGFNVEFKSSNDNIVQIKDMSNKVYGSFAGEAIITAYSPNRRILGEPTIHVRVLKVLETLITWSSEDVIVGSIQKFECLVRTDDGIKVPKTVKWAISGTNTFRELYDKTMLFCPTHPGKVTISCTVHHLFNYKSDKNTGKVTIDVIPALSVQPTEISIPVGGGCNIRTLINLPAQFTAVTEGISISEDGNISASKQGTHVIRITYRSQIKSLLVSVSVPSSLYLEVIEPNKVRPILLDQNYIPYFSQTNVVLSFDTEYEPIFRNGYYEFRSYKNTVVTGEATIKGESWIVSNKTMITA